MIRLLTELAHKFDIENILLPCIHDHVGSVKIDDSICFTSLYALVVLCDPSLENVMLFRYDCLLVCHL